VGIIYYSVHNSISYAKTLWGVRVMVFNGSFNNISAISWQSLLLETGIPEENHQPVASHWQTLSHNVVLSTPSNVSGDRHWLHS
jgi:hypothetical protein